jgi:hypothetical protein
MNQTSIEVLNFLNTLLSESFSYLRSETSPDLDPWQLLNWMFVSFYWTLLATFGQVQPTTYPLSGIFSTAPIYDFSQPSFWTSSNNIFVNNTLFQIYSEYALEFFALTGQPIPQFMPLDQNNHLETQETTFIHGYACQQRKLKHGYILSVFPAVFAPLATAWGLLMFLVIRIDTSRRNRIVKSQAVTDMQIIVAERTPRMAFRCQLYMRARSRALGQRMKEPFSTRVKLHFFLHLRQPH